MRGGFAEIAKSTVSYRMRVYARSSSCEIAQTPIAPDLKQRALQRRKASPLKMIAPTFACFCVQRKNSKAVGNTDDYDTAGAIRLPSGTMITRIRMIPLANTPFQRLRHTWLAPKVDPSSHFAGTISSMPSAHVLPEVSRAP